LSKAARRRFGLPEDGSIIAALRSQVNEVGLTISMHHRGGFQLLTVRFTEQATDATRQEMATKLRHTMEKCLLIWQCAGENLDQVTLPSYQVYAHGARLEDSLVWQLVPRRRRDAAEPPPPPAPAAQLRARIKVAGSTAAVLTPPAAVLTPLAVSTVGAGSSAPPAAARSSAARVRHVDIAVGMSSKWRFDGRDRAARVEDHNRQEV
jgi:hypothetical protein